MICMYYAYNVLSPEIKFNSIQTLIYPTREISRKAVFSKFPLLYVFYLLKNLEHN